MSITVTDPAILAAMALDECVIPIRDGSGKIVGFYTNNFTGKMPPGVKSPFTDEQLEEFMKGEDSEISGSEYLRQLEEKE